MIHKSETQQLMQVNGASAILTYTLPHTAIIDFNVPVATLRYLYLEILQTHASSCNCLSSSVSCPINAFCELYEGG